MKYLRLINRIGHIQLSVVSVFVLLSIACLPVHSQDTDNDALADNEEATWGCDPNKWDSDGDGMPDGWEVNKGLIPYIQDGNSDKDMDGLTNAQEYSYGIPVSWNVSINGVWWNGTEPSVWDTDEDGMPDGWEANNGLDPRDNGTTDVNNGPHGDPDNDGAINSEEYPWGIDPHDWDSDDDGIPDGWEIYHGLIPFSPDDEEDFDRDKLTNIEEYGYRIPITWNVTNDGVWWNGTDPYDIDSDNDSMPDGWELWYNLDPCDDGVYIWKFDPATKLIINNTIPGNPRNGPAGDPDGDGAINSDEYLWGIHPYLSEKFGIDTLLKAMDSDNDGMPDGWEILYDLIVYSADAGDDYDWDTLTNLFEYKYGRPKTWSEEVDGVWWNGTNPSKSDTDNDTLPDNWEIKYDINPNDDGTINENDGAAGDQDNDGLINKLEYACGTSPLNPDSDNDGMPDGWEVNNGLDPYLPADNDRDPDKDNLTNLQEYLSGTDPQNEDTDGDGASDSEDALPLDASESMDTDGDGIGNNADFDDDDDGVNDTEDAFPNDFSEYMDTDGDGIGDNADIDDDNDNITDSLDAFPLDPTENLDTDEDTVGNNADTDDDNDGIADNEDAFPLDPNESIDTDGDNIGNVADIDDDNDNIPDSEDVFPLNSSESSDTDGDNLGDNLDPDDDNDGFLDDWEEFLGTNPLDSNSTPVDTDNDGRPDGDINNSQPWMDTDDDGDGIMDSKDPDSPGITIDNDKGADGGGANDYWWIIIIVVIVIVILIIGLFIYFSRRKSSTTQQQEPRSPPPESPGK